MCGKNSTPATKRRARLAYLKRHTPKCQASGVRHSPHTIHNYQKPSALHILQRPLWPSPMIPLSPFPLQGRHCTTSHSISTQFQQPRSSLPTNPTHPNLTTPVPILPHSSSRTSKKTCRTTPRPPPRSNHPTNHPQIQESTTTGLPKAIVTCRCGANETGVIAAARKAVKSSPWFLLGYWKSSIANGGELAVGSALGSGGGEPGRSCKPDDPDMSSWDQSHWLWLHHHDPHAQPSASCLRFCSSSHLALWPDHHVERSPSSFFLSSSSLSLWAFFQSMLPAMTARWR